jgi:hypothetical protein
VFSICREEVHLIEKRKSAERDATETHKNDIKLSKQHHKLSSSQALTVFFFFSHFSVEKNDKGNSNKRAQYLPLLSAHANPTFFSFSQVTSPAEI